MMELQPQSHYLLNPNKLISQFSCTICLNPIQDCYITRCGHVFCKGCIQQTVNRHHRCPFCTQPLNQFNADVFKNYHFNSIRKIVQDERKKWQQGYLKGVWKKHQDIEIQQGERALMEPIQKKIVEQCQQSLLRYRNYLLQLYRAQHQAQQRKLLSGVINVRTHQQIIKSIHKSLLQNFPNPIIAPQLINIPTTLQIYLPGNKIHKSTIRLSPLGTFGSILPHLNSLCSQLNLRMVGPISDSLVINSIKTPISSNLGILVGTTIKIQSLPFENNVYCYSFKWQKNKQTDFYTCRQCNVKWICQNCALHCHAGHPIIIQLKNHKADWACCYCVTKSNCKAINKQSQ